MNSSCKPTESRSVFVTIQCNLNADQFVPLPFRKGLRAAFQEQRSNSRGMATVVTSNEIFNEVMCRSMADLAILTTATPQGPYPYAGIPWYSTTFGRDGIITAHANAMVRCSHREGSVAAPRRSASDEFDPLADAEPGKILHEMRGGEMAALREVPFGHYYGSVDSTPLFVMLAGLYGERTGDIETLRELWPHVEAALNWIDAWRSRRRWLCEYHRAASRGWSIKAGRIHTTLSSMLTVRSQSAPIALCEVQGYVYAAKRLAAKSARRLDKHAFADALDTQAAKLAERFEATFWCEDIGTYALALDGEKASVPRTNLECRTSAV